MSPRSIWKITSKKSWEQHRDDLYCSFSVIGKNLINEPGGKSMYKILVAVDMQNDFITGPLGNEACRNVVPEVVKVIKTGQYDEIFLTRDTHYDNYLKTQEGRKLPVMHTQIHTHGWDIQKDIQDAVFSVNACVSYFNKNQFGSEQLMDRIKSLYEAHLLDELQIDFVGVCTGICVISNVLPAKMVAPEAAIRVIENACACVTPESHKTAIEAMRLCQVDIVEEGTHQADRTQEDSRAFYSA